MGPDSLRPGLRRQRDAAADKPSFSPTGATEVVARNLAATPDQDGDDLDDLAATGEFGTNGESSQSLLLLSLAGGTLKSLGGIAAAIARAPAVQAVPHSA